MLRFRASAALALARASSAGAVKPARVLRADKRAVSLREVASAALSAACWRQVRKRLYSPEVSAATDTRASCQSASAPNSRAVLAFCAVVLPLKLWLGSVGGVAGLLGAAITAYLVVIVGLYAFVLRRRVMAPLEGPL